MKVIASRIAPKGSPTKRSSPSSSGAMGLPPMAAIAPRGPEASRTRTSPSARPIPQRVAMLMTSSHTLVSSGSGSDHSTLGAPGSRSGSEGPV